MNIIDPWKQPQKKIELPRYERLYKADEIDLETLNTLENEPLIELTIEPNDETDYVIHHRDGSITRVSDCVTINGTRWLLTPGRNQIPKSVYEFYLQCPEQRRVLPTPTTTPECIGQF